MTSTDNTVSELVINKMTQAQYDALATKLDTELYLVPDDIPYPIISQTSTTATINPNTFNKWTSNISSLTVTLAAPTDNSVMNEYVMEFTIDSSASSPTITITNYGNNAIVYANTPNYTAGNTY